MYIRVDDGVAIFATHFISATLDDKVRKLLPSFQIEPNGIVVYPEQNVGEVEQKLIELQIPYTIEELSPDPTHITKAQGVKYASRSEALEHLTNDKEPENEVIPNLQKKLSNVGLLADQLKNDNGLLRNRLKIVEDALLVVMFRGVS